jgi:thiamine pyrophosphate-dependent acetolactate synthase large subunit-like protein
MTATNIDRRSVLRELFPEPAGLLLVAGLAGAARDAAAFTLDGSNLFALGGAMGGATMIGLGMAIGAPDRRVVVITGDGELLMNIGALATITNAEPPNLAVVCLDNGRHGETGNQLGHTAKRTDLELMARGAGFTQTMTAGQWDDLPRAARFVDTPGEPRFLVIKIMDTPPSAARRLMDPAACRLRFRDAVLTQQR